MIKKLTDHAIEFNTLKLVQADLVTKTGFNNKYSNFNRKIILNKTRNVLNEKELKKLKAFDLGYFPGKNYFDEDRAQNYLIFHSILKYFTLNSTWITKWTSKGLSNESLEDVMSSSTLVPSIDYYEEKVRLKFNGSILQEQKKLHTIIKKL